jgi:chemotaxis protein CheD
MGNTIKVGMADLKVGSAPDTLISYGLGSCVGIAIYDGVAKVGGLAHIMLPDSSQSRKGENPAKFADTAIPILVKDMIKLGAVQQRLIAKIAGGAQMFNFSGSNDVLRIGERNAEAVKMVLQKEGIRIVSEDVGGSHGRTVELILDSGIYKIKTIEKGNKEL